MVTSTTEVTNVSKASEVRAPVLLLVVDIQAPLPELKALRQSVQQSLASIPSNVLIGLVTYGTCVQLYPTDPNSKYPTSYVLPGYKNYTGPQVQTLLGKSNIGRFFRPVGTVSTN